MSVLNRKRLGKIGVVFGIVSFLMLFVIPFFIIKLPGTDNKLYAGIYFVIFLICTYIGNVTMEKSNKPLSLDEEREEKIRQVLNDQKSLL
jgi:hypothetical protein